MWLNYMGFFKFQYGSIVAMRVLCLLDATQLINVPMDKYYNIHTKDVLKRIISGHFSSYSVMGEIHLMRDIDPVRNFINNFNPIGVFISSDTNSCRGADDFVTISYCSRGSLTSAVIQARATFGSIFDEGKSDSCLAIPSMCFIDLDSENQNIESGYDFHVFLVILRDTKVCILYFVIK